jgi:hypothetical protein
VGEADKRGSNNKLEADKKRRSLRSTREELQVYSSVADFCERCIDQH